ncbi:sensor domain-containing protein [Neobacillus sp. LXY-1]|uniref:sensor domain-containing protein n=1 Tax=Neobacillus sp. LXY-1 TaxID=3379133 RepID=UPI003EE09C60
MFEKFRGVTSTNYKSLFDQNPDVVISFDTNGIFMEANNAISDLFGYDVDELLNQSFAPLVVPSDLKKALSYFEEAVNGEANHYECWIIDKGGNERKVNVTNIPIYNNGVITGIFAIVKDITENYRIQTLIIEAENKYRSLVENSQVGVYILHNRKIVYVNPYLCKLTGYSLEELHGMNLSNIIMPDDQVKVDENIKKLYLNKGTGTVTKFRVKGKYGNPIYVEGYGSKVANHGKDSIIGTVIDVTEKVNSEKIIRHMAYHDQLTNLPNRYYLKEKMGEVIENAEKNNSHFAVIFLDLDRFKAVNDNLGHEIGDKLLMDIAERLKGCVSKKDIISRYGGDEFAILLPEKSSNCAAKVSQIILNSLSQPYYLNHHEIFVTPSIGISMYPIHGSDFDQLIKNADLSMYYAKSLGKNNYQFFNDSLENDSKNELDYERELRKALERNEFVLYYQPQINMETNEIIGAEALIRWQHPEKGMIPPAEFIPIAEESGLIIPIGEWVLKSACLQNKKWQEEGMPPFTMAVNISAKQFFQSNLPEIVKRTLVETGLEPKYLELEITESMTMNVERAISMLLELKKIGVKISIDDFGTGYSSLYYLKKFPIDKLKVDQSFIRDCINDVHDETIVKTIISMAKNLKLQVIAEGVETKEHVSFLLNQMCNEAQGYFYSKPVPVTDFKQVTFK